MPKKETWVFIFAALGGFGGLACIFQWLGITPKDLSMTKLVVVPHIFWLFLGLGLFAASLWSTLRAGILQKRSIEELNGKLSKRDEDVRESARRNLEYRGQIERLNAGYQELETSHKDELRRIEMQHNNELENSQEAYRQCMLERGAAMHGAEGCMAKLSLFAPLELEAYRLAKELRQFVGGFSFPSKESYGYNGQKFPNEDQIAAYHSARREVEAKLIFGYQRRIAKEVKDFILRIGEEGYPVFNADWDSQRKTRIDFLKLSADLDMVGLWFSRGKDWGEE